MTRLSLFSSPLLLGFEEMERSIDRAAKRSSDGYPPYNIEQTGPDSLRITLALAGFAAEDLDVRIEDRQLVIEGKRPADDENRVFLHRGIATRQFQRCFVLADGIEIEGASLDAGLLHVAIRRPQAPVAVRSIAISTPGQPTVAQPARK